MSFCSVLLSVCGDKRYDRGVLEYVETSFFLLAGLLITLNVARAVIISLQSCKLKLKIRHRNKLMSKINELKQQAQSKKKELARKLTISQDMTSVTPQEFSMKTIPEQPDYEDEIA